MRAFVCQLLNLAACASALGAEYYVSKTAHAPHPAGSDANNGSISSPFATLTRGLSAAQAGDTVFVRGDTYVERVSLPRSGTASAPIIFRAYPGETPVIDLSSATVPANQGDMAAITVTNRSHVVVQGFTIQNWRTSDPKALPEGILVNATNNNASTNVRILGNTIHHVEQNSPSTLQPGDAHGIKVAGRSNTAMSGIVIDGNHLYSLRLGTSESLVVNGNVSGFRITNNIVHDCNNIGIDMIGFEGSLPASINRARDGICAGNVVYNIDARYNPGYGGAFDDPTNGDPSAAGIYVDGGTNIVIERNLVYACNYGVEIASEEDLANGGKADFITLRNNLIRHNHQSGLIMGGYNSSKGSTEHCTIINNTLYQNGTFGSTVQIFGQHHVQNNVFKNNVVVTTSGTRLVLGVYPSSAVSTFSGNVFSYNLYYSTAGGAQFDATNTKSLSSWQSSTTLSGGDVGSTSENPVFAERSPASGTAMQDYAPGNGSPMINSGEPSPPYQVGSSERDLMDRARLRGGRVDRGAVEH